MRKSICITSLLLIVMLLPSLAFAQEACKIKCLDHKDGAACHSKEDKISGATKVALES